MTDQPSLSDPSRPRNIVTLREALPCDMRVPFVDYSDDDL